MKKLPKKLPQKEQPVQTIDNFWTKPEIAIEIEKNLNKWKTK